MKNLLKAEYLRYTRTIIQLERNYAKKKEISKWAKAAKKIKRDSF